MGTDDSQAAAANPAPRRKRRRRIGRIGRWLVLVPVVLGVGVVGGYKGWQWAAVPKGAPVIGVSLDTAWHSRIGVTSRTYDVALTRVGAHVSTIRPGDESAEQVLDRIDALLLTGGGDVDPELYGGDPETAQLVDRGRDEFELALIREALRRDMPILGICRGIQILNVAHGGTLRSLREDEALAEVHGITTDSLHGHPVTLAGDSRLAGILRVREKQVNSFHGQAVDRVGDGLRAVATAPDGVVEALERPDRRFVVTMQWHPELLSLENHADLAVFERLVNEAKAYRTRRPR